MSSPRGLRRETDLGKQAFYLAQSRFYLGAVFGGYFVEGEGEQGLHPGSWVLV